MKQQVAGRVELNSKRAERAQQLTWVQGQRRFLVGVTMTILLRSEGTKPSATRWRDAISDKSSPHPDV
jgi:hypothetical protein